MNNRLDLSMAQRLGIGFGAVVLVVAVALLLMFRWHSEGVRAQTAYTDRIAPLRERVRELDADVYRVGIALRAAALNPSAERANTYRGSAAAARASLDLLGSSAMEVDGRRLYSAIDQATEAYLGAADQVVARLGGDGISSGDETVLGNLREEALTLTREFGDLQDAAATAALAEIAAERARTSTGLVTMGIVATLMLVALAVLTTRAITQPTRQLLRTASGMARGDWKPALALAPAQSTSGGAPPLAARDEMRQLADAFGSAAVALEQREQRLRADARVAKAVGSTLDRHQLCDSTLRHVVEQVGAEIGVVYAMDRKGELVPAASYALPADLPAVAIGEGVPGLAARDRRTVVVDDIPADSGFAVRLGYDRAPPKEIAALPLVFQDTLHGVLLVGSLRGISNDARAFLEASAAQLGIGLQNVAAHDETQRLLEEVRESNERIQAQNEELQVQNEEIQAQNEEIQAQHEEIQAQNEELLQQGEELRRHVAQLAEADARKNQFIGVLAHELRNPMTPIANSVHILKRSAPGSESAQRAQAVIERQVTHLVRLVDDLLDITRISEGKIHVQRRPLDLVQVVHACAEDLSSAFEQHGTRLEIDVPESPVEVNGDRTRLSQVLGNLLNNSMKFSERGTVKVSVRVDHANREAVLRVTDDGVGMESGLLPKLFQPFSQGISGLARIKGGLGLGLALVKALVTLHEGRVSAHSDGPGRGAEFTVRLPLASADAAAARPDSPVGAVASQAARAMSRVLVIEDNADAASSLREALELEGYEVAVALSGREGLDLAATFEPHVVLCDIGLPELDGYEVAKQLRADARTRSVLLIALTGYAAAADKELAQAAGFDLHLAKPLKVTSFTETVAALARGDG